MKEIKHKRWNIKNRWLLILFLGIILLGAISCEKYPKPYLKKWVGTYECERKRDDYESEKVIVDVTAKGESTLHIEERGLEVIGGYKVGVRQSVKVNKDGSFSNVHESVRPMIEGAFYKDSLYISYTDWSPNNTMFINYKGKKQKKKL
ncbi:MAG: hypothetical protein FWC34_06130 [Bacteroidetes bacterium]|nr:hypothetical protein [Bacteroidota bacterium]MCL2302972.1 hypothetical protein [Lentimicrobiaceae bacterium]